MPWGLSLTLILGTFLKLLSWEPQTQTQPDTFRYERYSTRGGYAFDLLYYT